MLVKSEKRYASQLADLWERVFGDEREYIDLFFGEAYKEAKTFVHIENGKIVSALYLLDGGIEISSKRYDGYYLYAAATLPEHRRRGIMSALLEEAKAFADSENKFIALVPASDSLYGYYSRFGFFEAMHKYAGVITSDKEPEATEINAEEYYDLTEKAVFDRFYKSRVNTLYSLECLAYCGFTVYSYPDGVIITDGTSVKEAFAENEEKLKSLLQSCALSGIDVEVPFDLNFKEVRFGMVYTSNALLKNELMNKKIYMNLALD